MSEGLRVLSSGVDTLYFSSRGKLRDGLIEALEACRTEGGGRSLRFEFGEGGTAFVRRGYGWKGYRHWLEGPGFDVMVGVSETFPPVYVQLRSDFIHEMGVSVALAEVVRILVAHFFAGEFTLDLSRLDVYCDLQGWEPRPADFERFVSRATARTHHEIPGGEAELFGTGRRLSGFTFGRKEFVARIYEKRLQMAATGKDWQMSVWKDADPDAAVWRIEFQARRPVLAALELRTAEEGVRRRQGLWDYGGKWLSLREAAGHSRVSRRPVAPVWAWVQRVQLGEPCEPLVRARARLADERRLIAAWTGYSTSYAALQRLQRLTDTTQVLGASAEGYLARAGRSFEGEVEHKRSLLVDRAPVGATREA